MTALARRIRRCVVIAALLGVAAGIAGMLPGHQHFADSRDCFGIGLSTLFGIEHPPHAPCEPVYDKLVGESPAGGYQLALYIAVVLACGGFVYRRPSRANAFGWSVLAIFIGAAWIAATFSLGHMFEQTKVLPAARVTEVLFGSMMVVVVPITMLVALIGNRWARDDGPRARIVT